MTAANPALSIDPHFTCLAPESADPHRVTAAQISDELTRELEARRNGYPRRIQKGQLHRLDAERQIDLLHAIRDDFSWLAAFAVWHAGQEPVMPAALAEKRNAAEAAMLKYRWSDIVAELRREILLRRRYYPKWIAGGTLDRTTARRQLERIEAAHFTYWRDGRFFMPDELHQLRDRIFPAHRETPEFQAYRAAAHAHFARFDRAGKRGEYTDQPSVEGEPQLAFA